MSKKSTTLKISLYLLFFSFLFPAFTPVFATPGGSYETRVIDQTKYIDKYFEVDQNGNFKANIYLGDQKLGVVDNNGIDYYVTDHLGSPVIVTDQAGQVVETNDYETYGQLKNTNTSIDNPYKYTGKELGTETNLQYYGARYYDNRIGRFTSVDPATLKVFSGDLFEKQYGQNLEFFLSDPQNLNSYSYTVNNPIKLTDPDGHSGVLAVFGLLAADFLFNINKAVAPGLDYNSRQASQSQTNDFPSLVSERYNSMNPAGKFLGMMLLTSGTSIEGKVGNKVANVAEGDVVKLYHGTGHFFTDITKEGFKKGQLWLTDSAALAEHYSGNWLGEGLDKGVINVDLPRNIYNKFIKSGELIIDNKTINIDPFWSKINVNELKTTSDKVIDTISKYIK